MSSRTNTAGQPALPYSARLEVRDRRVLAGEVDRMVEALRGRGWVKAAALGFELQCNARHLRAVANASGGLVLGWRLGYALTREVSDDEADAVERRLLSQARRMTARAVAIRNARNGRIAA